MTATTKSTTDKVMTTPVLTTPEILEMILVQTDMRTLLTSAQRVCRDWLDLITTSPSIQKALFFTPIKDSEPDANEKTLNPLLTETFPSIFPAKDRTEHYGFDFSDLEWTKDPSSLAHFARVDASWRKMLVQQPPIPELGLFRIYHARGGDSAGCSSIPVSFPHSILPYSTVYKFKGPSNISSYTQAHEKDQKKNCEGLCMGRLFDILLFAREVQFSIGMKVRVYWSAENPRDFDESYPKINDEFHRMLERYSIIIYTRKVMQCSMGLRSPLSDSESTRMGIIKAYREHGLDVNLKRREIQYSTRLGDTDEGAGCGRDDLT